MALALFDLDNTLLNGDSDHSFGEFLCQNNYVDASAYQKANDRFYEDYKNGTLDIIAYQEFAISALKTLTKAQQVTLHNVFMDKIVDKMILPKAKQLVQTHKNQGDLCIIITATNSFVSAPIAKKFDIDHLIATEPEKVNGEFTGKIKGVPCFQDGKITKLNLWLEEHNQNMDHAFFYSDSYNDLPLLNTVPHPIAVDPDDKLTEYAIANNWPIISLRDELNAQ